MSGTVVRMLVRCRFEDEEWYYTRSVGAMSMESGGKDGLAVVGLAETPKSISTPSGDDFERFKANVEDAAEDTRWLDEPLGAVGDG